MSSANNLRKDAEELNRLSLLTESANVKRILSVESSKLMQVAEAEEKKNQASPQKAPQEAGRPSIPTSKLTNYGWDQSEKFMKMYVTYNGVHKYPSEHISASYTDKSFKLQILDEEKKITRELEIKHLLHPIKADDSYFKVKTDMVLLYLKKASPQNWACVTEAEKKSKDSKVPKMDNKDEDPGAGLMSLMKQMYEGGDDDMKRTIAKAWTEARDKKSPDDVL